MRRTRAVSLTALVAASAMVFAACSSSPGQAPVTSASSSSGSTASSGSSAPSSGASSSGGATSGTASSGPATSGANAGTGNEGCGAAHGAFPDPGTPAGAVTVGDAELASSYNNYTSHGNSVYNANPQYLVQANMFYYDKDLKLVNNDSFVKCEVTSKSPLTVQYTINKDAKWSDGVPITGDDLLMQWYSGNSKFNVKGVAFDTSSVGMNLISKMPTMSADGKTFTAVYDKPFVDYQLNFGPTLLPAHVVAEKALGITDPTAALKALTAAVTANDSTKMKKVANFWNTGFDFTQLPSDKSMYLSSGPYILTDFKKDQYMTFKINPAYTWGPKPSIATITDEFQPDATAAVQALQNGELQIIDPEHPTAGFAKGVAALKSQGIESVLGANGSYEHVDLVFDNGGPFDPKTYGGDAKKALAVRTAFLKTIPRQSIVDRLVKPINPKATVRDAFSFVPGAPGYDEDVAANGMKAYDQVDIAGAKALLAQAGVTAPKVRLLYSATNPIRVQEFQLIAQSALQAGITVVDGKDPDWSSHLSSTAKYDASLFAWSNQNLGISVGSPPNYLGKNGGQWTGANNFGHFNNEQVNKDMNQILTVPDVATQNKLLISTDTQLVKDAFGTILWQYPDVTAFDSSKVTGVSSIPLTPTVFWNFWEWKLAS